MRMIKRVVRKGIYIKGVRCVPAMKDGNIIEDYFVDVCGDILSTKGEYAIKLKPNYGSAQPYPAVVLFKRDKSKLHVKIHRLVCESWYEIPIVDWLLKFYNGANIEDKLNFEKMLYCYYQVNHIDHDHCNYHPDNLEFLSNKENTRAYHEVGRHLIAKRKGSL